MPELAEVEYYRKQWNCGLKQKVLGVELHPHSRAFRGADARSLAETLTGAVLRSSETHGKQMFFRFSPGGWLGLHMGMTGRLHVGPPDYVAGRHDHLVLRQKKQSLLFTDPRQFGRVRFEAGAAVPPWRAGLPAAILSNQFTRETMERFLRRHPRQPLKAALLMQDGFPGVGNWMADEILWQARLHPEHPSGQLTPDQSKRLYRQTRFVCRESLRTIAVDDGDPPAGWFFHQRWGKSGHCPRDGSALRRAEIGGRTTCWCQSCQR